MHAQARAALELPIFDPTTYDVSRLAWRPARLWSAVLSVNIGME